MRVLNLTLKAKWYDRIESGEKLEEYRDIKPYWIKRLIVKEWKSDKVNSCPTLEELKMPYGNHNIFWALVEKFDAVHFARGGHFHPTLKQMTLKCKGIEIGIGKPEWGAEPGREYFVIKLGEIITPGG